MGQKSMNETLLDATLKVIIDGQAYLYAHALQLDLEQMDEVVTDEMFENFEDNWKKETAALIESLIQKGGDEQ